MYMEQPSGLSGLGAVECRQPIPGAERNELRAELYRKVVFALDLGRTQAKQLHEGHPDIKKIMKDIHGRATGLWQRPRLLRCEKEARDRAHGWISNTRKLWKLVKQNVGGDSMTVIPPAGLTFKVYRGGTYNIRGPYFHQAFRPIPNIDDYLKDKGAYPPAGGAPARPSQLPSAQLPSARSPSAAQLPSIELPPAAAGVWSSLTSGEIYGVPKVYLTYGILGLVGYNFLFGKRRR